MNLNRVKIECAVTFLKYLASTVSSIFLPRTLIWNRTTFELSDSMNLAELVVNQRVSKKSKSLQRISPKKFTNISFSIRFIIAYGKDFRCL